MAKTKKIMIVSESRYSPDKMYVDQMPKLAKGFVRLGHDTRRFSYCGLLRQLGPFKIKRLLRLIYKKKVDEILRKNAKHYQPDIVYISFARLLNADTVNMIREVCPKAVFIGGDGDPWPSRQEGRIDMALALDILMATNNGTFLDEY